MHSLIINVVICWCKQRNGLDSNIYLFLNYKRMLAFAITFNIQSVVGLLVKECNYDSTFLSANATVCVPAYPNISCSNGIPSLVSGTYGCRSCSTSSTALFQNLSFTNPDGGLPCTPCDTRNSLLAVYDGFRCGDGSLTTAVRGGFTNWNGLAVRPCKTAYQQTGFSSSLARACFEAIRMEFCSWIS